MRLLERQSSEQRSPVRSALAYVLIGITALVGGNIIDQHDGEKESVPAALAQLGGGLLAALGVKRGIELVGIKSLTEAHEQQAQEHQRILDGLPKLRDGFDPVHICNRLNSLQRGSSGTIEGVDPNVVSGQLFNTQFAVKRALDPYSLLESFHNDVRRAIEGIADARIGTGLNGYIWDRGDEVFVLPGPIEQLSRFLDDAAPIEPNRGEGLNWLNFMSLRAGKLQIARLLGEPETGRPPSLAT